MNIPGLPTAWIARLASLALLLGSLQSASAGAGKDSLEVDPVVRLRSIIDNMKHAIEGDGHGAYRIDFRIDVVNANGEQGFEGAAYFENDRVSFESDLYNYYDDGATRLAVLPGQKEAYLYGSNALDNPARIDQAEVWRDTLFTSGKVVSKRLLRGARTGGKVWTIVMQPPAGGAWGPLRQVTWTFDAAADRLISSRMDYRPGALLKSFTFTFRSFDPGVRHSQAHRSVSTAFMSGGRLKGDWKGFEVFDRRKKAQ